MRELNKGENTGVTVVKQTNTFICSETSQHPNWQMLQTMALQYCQSASASCCSSPVNTDAALSGMTYCGSSSGLVHRRSHWKCTFRPASPAAAATHWCLDTCSTMCLATYYNLALRSKNGHLRQSSMLPCTKQCHFMNCLWALCCCPRQFGVLSQQYRDKHAHSV